MRPRLKTSRRPNQTYSCPHLPLWGHLCLTRAFQGPLKKLRLSVAHPPATKAPDTKPGARTHYNQCLGGRHHHHKEVILLQVHHPALDFRAAGRHWTRYLRQQSFALLLKILLTGGTMIFMSDALDAIISIITGKKLDLHAIKIDLY